MQPLRVTFLAGEASPINGTGTVMHELAMALADHPQLAVQILATKTSSRGHDPALDGHVRYVLPKWTPTFRGRPHKLLPMLWGKVELPPTDLLHAMVEFPYAVLAQRLARQAGIPYIVSTHGTYAVAPFVHWENRTLYRQAIRRAAAVTACSRFVARSLREASGIERKVDVVDNPVDYGRFQVRTDPRAVRARFKIPEEARVILGMGALKPRKGFDVLIRAFARVAPQEPQALLVIGAGGDPQPYQALAASLGVGERVRLPGAVPTQELIGLYQTCEIFAHLPRWTRMHFEGFGLVYLEAGACGKPVVGTRSGGVPEVVLDGETGLLVDEEDVEGAAAAFLKLLRNPELARSMGAAGRRRAATFDRDHFAQRVIEVYQRVRTR